MLKKSIFLACILGVLCFVVGGCILSSPQYHIDMYSGRTEIKTMPLVRYWFCSWGTYDNFERNLLEVPFAIPLFVPIGISLDVVTDMTLYPVDLLLSLALEEECTFSLTEENDAFYISLPKRKPSIAYSFCFGEECRLLLLQIHRGSLSIRGEENSNKQGTWCFTANGFVEHGSDRNELCYESGSGVLLVLGRNFTPISNPFPFMQHQNQGYRLYLNSYGIFSVADCVNLKEALSKKTWMKDGQHITRSYPRLIAILDYLPWTEELGWQMHADLVEKKVDAYSKITFKFEKTKDFQGTLVDLGFVSDYLHDVYKINTDSPEINDD